MKIGVLGLWHLGSVTASALASLGHHVIGVDPDEKVVKNLSNGIPPLFEPGLEKLVQTGLQSESLVFTADYAQGVKEVEILWVAFDTPVNDDDEADVIFVVSQIKAVIPYLSKGVCIIISSQLPVGSVAILEQFSRENYPELELDFAYSPENLRLGKALDVFLNPDRIVVGVRSENVKSRLSPLLDSISSRIEWMGVESAEMTKHAINAFLAVSITFANEIAAICELVGADAKEVERGLKSESRIGPKAYLSPGGPFAGGTLARDIEFLGLVSKPKGLITPVLSGVKSSNDEHKKWVQRQLLDYFGVVKGQVVTIWGMTYKPGTDTLRRSLAVELCNWLLENGANVHVYDPEVRVWPAEWGTRVLAFDDPLDAIAGTSALVVGTEWPELIDPAGKILEKIVSPLLVLDPNRHLLKKSALDKAAGVIYQAVGSKQTRE